MNHQLFYKSSLEGKTMDKRGFVYKGMFNDKEYLFLQMHQGSFRGGHYHDKETVHLILHGKIKFDLIDPITLKRSEMISKPMDIIRIPKGIAHLLEATEESMFMEPLDNNKKSTNYKPQRLLVKKYLEFH